MYDNIEKKQQKKQKYIVFKKLCYLINFPTPDFFGHPPCVVSGQKLPIMMTVFRNYLNMQYEEAYS